SIREVMDGGGGLKSSVNDLLTFLAANLGYVKTPLAQAMAAQLSIRRSTEPSLPGMEIAYVWVIQTKNGKSIIWHNGSSPGYRAYIGFDPKSRAGVVVLSNWFTRTLTDDIGRHLLDQSYPLP
ncbi:MAG TPA: serine hydrolase domain-containing protein, partial [Bryobacteraceae bacterium]|nr:serine hydrolase domain-containing protein [Bryobacteraceae bacterium]